MYEISKSFTFEAAHHLPTLYPADHPNYRLHGHSFRVVVYIHGYRNERSMVLDFETLSLFLKNIQVKLDHRYLNEIEGLEIPTLENISRWIYFKLAELLANNTEVEAFRVVVHRDSCGESCSYGDM